MQFIFKNKITVPEAFLASRPDIAMVMPDFDLFALYAMHCSAHNLVAAQCANLESVAQLVALTQPRLVLLDVVRHNEAAVTRFFAERNKRYGHVPVATIGFGIETPQLHQYLSEGVVQHINRFLTRPQDVPVIIKTFLI